MWTLADIKEETRGDIPLVQRVEMYIKEKNLNFIVAESELLNLRYDILGQDKVRNYLNGYAGCDFSMVSIFNGKPSAPLIAADMDFTRAIARVQYHIDFNEEAKQGTASPFYSKILGAFATHFFQVQPKIERLWFPFVIHNIVGSKMGVQPEDSGTCILKTD